MDTVTDVTKRCEDIIDDCRSHWSSAPREGWQ